MVRVHGYCFPRAPFTQRRRINSIKPGSKTICGVLRRQKMLRGIICTRRPLARTPMSFKYGLMRITEPWPACCRAHPGPLGNAWQVPDRHPRRHPLAGRPRRGIRSLRRRPRHLLSGLRKHGRRPQLRQKIASGRHRPPRRRRNPRPSPRPPLSCPRKHVRHPRSRQKAAPRRSSHPKRRKTILPARNRKANP